MSGTLPTSPDYSGVSVTSRQPAIVSKSESGKRQARLTGGHLWLMTINYPPMLRAEFSPIDAFIMLQDGEYDSFDVPYTLDNQGTWKNSSVIADGAVAVGATSVNVKGLAVGETAVAGDILRYGTHNKVYKVVVGGVADGAGKLTVEVRPKIIAAVADLDTVATSDVMFHMAIKGLHEFKVGAAELYRYELDLEEAL